MNKYFRDVALGLRDLCRSELTGAFMPQPNDAMKRKEDGSFAGKADETMQEKIIRFLLSYSGYPILSEERKHTWPPQHNCFWMVDPFDGSNNAKRGLWMLTGMMVSLVEYGRIIFSFIFVTEDERNCANGCFFAIRGEGAWQWIVDKPVLIHVSHEETLANGALLVEGPSRKVAANDAVRQLQRIMAWRNNLCSAISITRLAAGYADALVMIDNKPTDTVHCMLIVEEAGGKVTDLAGNPATLQNCNNLFCSNGVLHDAVLKTMQTGSHKEEIAYGKEAH